MNFNRFKKIDDISIKNRYEEAKSLKKLCDVLSKLKIKHWINCGTLLGAYREEKIIDHDNDLDLTAIINFDDNWICPLHGGKKYQINLLYELQQDFYIKTFTENQYVALRPREHSNFNLDQIDIGWFPSEESSYFPSFFLDELDTIKLYDIEFPCPRHLDLYIPLRYGSDWKTPKENFSPVQMLTPFKKNWTCYTSLVGDLFHEGHYNLLKRCKKLFQKVIVGVHNDEQVMSYKEKPLDSYEVRLENVKKTGLFDEIYENAPVITTQSFIDDLEVDFVVAGRESPEKIKKMYTMDINRLHLIERTPNISTSILKKIKLGLF